MRFGRNIVRTLLQYYRFTNVLNFPLVNEIKTKKHRPKTHRSRSRVRARTRHDHQSQTVKLRPKTTRAYAPISYNDLELLRDSSTSNECSPVRSGFGSRLTKNIFLDINTVPDQHNDQYSLLSIQTSKFKHLEFSDPKTLKPAKTVIEDVPKPIDDMLVNIPPKPSLSIIDFNQLTRGGLEQAKRYASQNRGRSVTRSDECR